MLFTAGSEGIIKAWNVPKLDNDDKFPTTNGNSFCVGVFKDSVAEPYWALKYHPFLHLLLAIKSNNII